MARTGMWVMALLATACSRNAADPAARMNGPADSAVSVDAAPAAMVAMEAAPKAAMARVAGAASGPGLAARMIVRSAQLTLQVRDVRAAAAQVSAATAAAEGFLGASRQWREGEQARASMTLRVPSAALDATLARLKGLAVRVDDESLSGEDVTRQAVDLQAQLTNLRATETELRALLTTVRQRTQKASDVLEVHTELARVRGEIDQHAAELQSLSQLAALSTVTVELRPDVVATPITASAWQPRGVLRDALRALAGTGRVAVDAVIWAVVYAAPLLLATGALGWALRGLWRRTRRAVAAAA